MIRVRFHQCRISVLRAPLVSQGARADVPIVSVTLRLIAVPQGARSQKDLWMIIVAQQVRIRRILDRGRPECP